MASTPAVFATPEEDTELAEKAFEAWDLPKTLELLRKAAAQSYAPAQVRLGGILDYSEDDEKAVRWFSIAVEQGSAAGALRTGLLAGSGVSGSWLQNGKFRLGAGIEQAKFWEARPPP